MTTTRDNEGNSRRGVNLVALEREVGEYVDEARADARTNCPRRIGLSVLTTA
jgi:hypothetical protein